MSKKKPKSEQPEKEPRHKSPTLMLELPLVVNEGQSLPRSMGVPRAGARRPQSLGEPTPEPAFLLTQGRSEAWKDCSEPPVL
jgi:hypothetical protein